MANSYTGEVNTNMEFETLASITSMTLTSGKIYSIQIQGIADLKIGDAIFNFINEKFNFKQGETTAYLKTTRDITLTVLESEE